MIECQLYLARQKGLPRPAGPRPESPRRAARLRRRQRVRRRIRELGRSRLPAPAPRRGRKRDRFLRVGHARPPAEQARLLNRHPDAFLLRIPREEPPASVVVRRQRDGNSAERIRRILELRARKKSRRIAQLDGGPSDSGVGRIVRAADRPFGRSTRPMRARRELERDPDDCQDGEHENRGQERSLPVRGPDRRPRSHRPPDQLRKLTTAVRLRRRNRAESEG